MTFRKKDEFNSQHAALQGLIASANHELSWQESTRIEIASDEFNSDTIKFISNEMLNLKKISPVLYSEQQRYVPKLENIESCNLDNHEIPFIKKGNYILLGGLGGIGTLLAKYLIQYYNANLLFVGRSDLNLKARKLSVSAVHYNELLKLSNNISYVQLDLSSYSNKSSLFEAIKEKLNGKLDGIIHLAAVFDEREIINEDPVHYHQMIDSKVIGTKLAVDSLGKFNKNGLLILMSSVNSFFGGSSVCTYSAANSILDDYANYLQERTNINCYCIHWSMWENVGMGKQQKKEFANANGYYSIDENEGLLSMQAALKSKFNNIFIGLDKYNKKISEFFLLPFSACQEIVTYYTSEEKIEDKVLSDILVKDKYGHKLNNVFKRVDNIPTLPGGINDESLFLREHPGIDWINKKVEYIAAQDPIELTLQSIIRDELNLDMVSTNDNFFDMGGNSLSLIRAHEKILKSFNVPVTIVDIFAHPNVETLAAFIKNFGVTEKDFSKSRERSNLRRRALGRKKHE